MAKCVPIMDHASYKSQMCLVYSRRNNKITEQNYNVSLKMRMLVMMTFLVIHAAFPNPKNVEGVC